MTKTILVTGAAGFLGSHICKELLNRKYEVIGVDTFEGDIHSTLKENHLDKTKDLLKEFENIKLIKSDYKDFIINNDETYDLIHIDIIHDYENTYSCGEWAVNHSPIVIFHDTISFPDVMNACKDLSIKYKLEFYNYPNSNGLGILYNKNFKLKTLKWQHKEEIFLNQSQRVCLNPIKVLVLEKVCRKLEK